MTNAPPFVFEMGRKFMNSKKTVICDKFAQSTNFIEFEI
jgi:hypothetical protein